MGNPIGTAVVAARKLLGQHKGFKIEGELIGSHGTTPPLDQLVELVESWLNKTTWASRPLVYTLQVPRCHIPARSFRGVKVVGLRPHDRKSLELLIRPEGSLRQYRGWLNCNSEQDAAVVLTYARPDLVVYCLRQDSVADTEPYSRIEQNMASINSAAGRADTSWKRLGKRLILRQFSFILLESHAEVGLVSRQDIAQALSAVGIEVSAEEAKFEEILNMLIMRGLIEPPFKERFDLSPALDEYANEWQLHQVREQIARADQAWRQKRSECSAAERELTKAEASYRSALERAEAARDSERSMQRCLRDLKDQEMSLVGASDE